MPAGPSWQGSLLIVATGVNGWSQTAVEDCRSAQAPGDRLHAGFTAARGGGLTAARATVYG